MIIVFLILRKSHKIYDAFGYLVIKHFHVKFPVTQIKLKQSIRRSELVYSISYDAWKFTAIMAVVELGLFSIFFVRGVLLFYMLGLMFFLYALPDMKINEKSKAISSQIMSDMPHTILSLRLLLLAGLPTSKAISMLCHESMFNHYIKECNKKVLHGESMPKVYSDLSYTFQLHYLTRFTRIMILDEKNGSSESINQLERLCHDIWLNKKAMIIKESEAASTKLLLPMMISLMGVLIAVTFPAIMQLFTII